MSEVQLVSRGIGEVVAVLCGPVLEGKTFAQTSLFRIFIPVQWLQNVTILSRHLEHNGGRVLALEADCSSLTVKMAYDVSLKSFTISAGNGYSL